MSTATQPLHTAEEFALPSRPRLSRGTGSGKDCVDAATTTSSRPGL